MTKKPLLAFIHIPRTGGTSFIDMVKRNMGADRVSKFPFDADRDWDKIEFIHGHFSYNIVQDCGLFDGRGISYVTILRHPVERVISAYYHSKSTEPISKWIETVKPRHWVENSMFYYLKGARDYESGDDYIWGSLKYDNPVFIKNSILFDLVNNRDWLTFKFEMMKSWNLNIKQLNATPNKRKQYIKFETRMKIAEMNRKDLQLYREFG